MVNLLEMLSLAGRAIFYTKGLFICVKKVVKLTLIITNCTSGSHGTFITEEEL